MAAENSQERRSIGFRLPKQIFQHFQEIARSVGMLPATLARTVIPQWIVDSE